MKKYFKQKTLSFKILALTVLCMLLNAKSSFAQTGSNSEITSKITDLVNKIKPPLDLAIGALGLVGAFYVFFLYKSGKPEAKDNLVKLVIGLSVWYLIVPILKVFGLAQGIQ